MHLTTIQVPFDIYHKLESFCSKYKYSIEDFVVQSIENEMERVKEVREDISPEKRYATEFKNARNCSCGERPEYFINYYDGSVRISCSICGKEIFSPYSEDDDFFPTAVRKWNLSLN